MSDKPTLPASNMISSYPRPDFARDNLEWLDLNGPWKFAFDDEDLGLSHEWCKNGLSDHHDKVKSIEVPFVYQTPASGIKDQGAHPIVWYERTVKVSDLPKCKKDEQLWLRFGAVDYECTVWVNGLKVGGHRGGHTPFEFNITNFLAFDSDVTIAMRVEDSVTDLTQPRGKQYWKPKPESIWYTPSTGSWQSIWIEKRPSVYIADSSNGLKLRSDKINTGTLECRIPVSGTIQNCGYQIMVRASLDGIYLSDTYCDVDNDTSQACYGIDLVLSEYELKSLSKPFLQAHPLDNDNCWRNGLALWSPEHPLLYDLKLILLDSAGTIVDSVTTYTGMRSLNWTSGDETFRLNGKPYFQALVLDQGYWPSTNMTPPTNLSCKEDILYSKAMGFNGCRKHQKVESSEFLYWADKLGYLVWGEMANAYEFSSQYTERFDQEWQECVRRDVNHPCIVAWTPVNESWAYTNLTGRGEESGEQQKHIQSLYDATKMLDQSRPVNDNCGWEHVCTDLTTFHDYADGSVLEAICATQEGLLGKHGGRDLFVPGTEHKAGTPIICTEFGGVNIALRKDEKGVDGEWGYTTAADSDDLLGRVRQLMEAIVRGGHCCGFVYTQLTDIEQETNGLYTFDRKEKLPAREVKEIVENCVSVYHEKLKARGVL